MKKGLVFFLAISLSIFFIACSSSKQVNTTDNPNNQIKKTAEQSPTSATVQLASKTNLEHWKITLEPNLAHKTEYLGDSPALNPKLTLKTGGKTNYSVSTNKFEPHSKGFEGGGLKSWYFGKVEIDLSWQENGKDMNGKAMYEIKPVK